MKSATKDRILTFWDLLEESEPDRSTEHLLMRTADMAGVSYSNVVSVVTKHRFAEVKAQ